MSNLRLFAASVAIWGSTWFAITFQLGRVEPEASVAYRFLLASLLLFAYCAARRLPLRFPPRDHAWIAAQGMTMFGASYIFVYYAEQHIVSGLVAVGFSASPLLGMFGQRLFFGTPITARIASGSVLGIAGIGLDGSNKLVRDLRVDVAARCFLLLCGHDVGPSLGRARPHGGL